MDKVLAIVATVCLGVAAIAAATLFVVLIMSFVNGSLWNPDFIYKKTAKKGNHDAHRY